MVLLFIFLLFIDGRCSHAWSTSCASECGGPAERGLITHGLNSAYQRMKIVMSLNKNDNDYNISLQDLSNQKIYDDLFANAYAQLLKNSTEKYDNMKLEDIFVTPSVWQVPNNLAIEEIAERMEILFPFSKYKAEIVQNLKEFEDYLVNGQEDSDTQEILTLTLLGDYFCQMNGFKYNHEMQTCLPKRQDEGPYLKRTSKAGKFFVKN